MVPARKARVLAPVHPNAGVEAALRKRLIALVDEMHRSVAYWVTAAYRANPPEMAQDATPASELRAAVGRLTARWQARFDVASQELADYYATEMAKRSDATLRAILKRGGFAVKFTATPAMRDVLEATITEQVGLIRSIPQRYLGEVEGAVMRSVQRGGDLGSLTKTLVKNYGVTKRRAALIARDQNNKATATFTRTRQVELGIEQAEWRHSGGGKHPRPSHVKAGKDRVRYDVSVGWLDPHEGKRIFPGELIACRCVSRAVIPEFA